MKTSFREKGVALIIAMIINNPADVNCSGCDAVDSGRLKNDWCHC